MKANELRIGNWVNSFDGGYVEVNGYLIMMMHDYPNHNMNPSAIILNNDILIKSGFSYLRDGSNVLQLIINYKNEDHPCTLQVSGSGILICRLGFYATCAPVFHLHELQNLYYSLTGKELKIQL